MSTLYELSAERLALQHKLEVLDMDAQTIEDTLDGNSTELEAKIENYGFVIRNMESFADAIKAERDRLDKRLKVHEIRVGHIKEWLKENMERCGISKMECPVFSIAIQKNPPSVVIDAESLIPEKYWAQPETPPKRIDKASISNAIKSGEIIDGVHLESSTRLSIK